MNAQARWYERYEWYKRIIGGRRLASIFLYILIGAGTTLISFGTFWLLAGRLQVNPHAANAVAVACAITFAYIANKNLVFNSWCRNFIELLKEIWRFVISRALTMLTEIGGLFLLHDICKLEAMAAKVAVSVIVLILNYLFFRFVVFPNESRRHSEPEEI